MKATNFGNATSASGSSGHVGFSHLNETQPSKPAACSAAITSRLATTPSPGNEA